MKGVYYKLLKSNQTVTAEYYQQQLIDLYRASNQKRLIIVQRKAKRFCCTTMHTLQK